MKLHLKWFSLLLLIVALFYWKILFTHQFSLLLEYEGANQGYSWYHFTAAALKQGSLPIWDPYTHSGRVFAGDMVAGVFYPLKLIFYIWPFNRSGLLSPQLYHEFFAFTHFLAACFMFLLAREMRLGNFASLVSGVCFSLAGFVGRVGWPDMLDSAIWLPLVFLCFLRAVHARGQPRGVLYACLMGLALGMTVLGGRLHITMMAVLAIGAAGIFAILQADRLAGTGPVLTFRKWTAAVLLAGALVTVAAGAVQLFPSVEYGGRAIRYLSNELALPATQRLPYEEVNPGFLPRAVMAFVLGFPFGGPIGNSELFSPYFGILPLLLVIVGVWGNWEQPWVKYLSGLAVVAFFYTLGSFSFLHGLIYSLAPYLWVAREPARFIYITHFAMAILAGFGAETLLAEARGAAGARYAGLVAVLKWAAILFAAALLAPALYGKPEFSDWVYFSFLVLLASYGLFAYILRGRRGAAVQFLVIAMIVCDVGAFNWTIRNKKEEETAGRNQFTRLLGCRNMANFLKSQPGLFRVDVLVDWPPSLGDLFGLQTTGGMSATVFADYEWFSQRAPRNKELLNVRYTVKAATATDPNPVYQDAWWKVYENPNRLPRAWVVNEVIVDPTRDGLMRRMADAGFEPRRQAFVKEPLGVELPPAPAAPAEVTFQDYRADRFQLTVRSQAPGLLVASEVDYPGWRASVNGQPARIHNVNGALRGVLIPAGESRVEMRYRPWSILLGACLSIAAFLGTGVFALVLRAREKRSLRAALQAAN